MSNLVQMITELARAVAADILSLAQTKADSAHTHFPAEVGLDQVDNTSDEDKPMSRAQRVAMAAKFNRGDVAQEVGDNSSKVISQKASTEAFYRAGSGVAKAGKIHVQSTAPTIDVEDGDIWLKI